MSNPIIINADGACSGNPGPGGWAATVERSARPVILLAGGDPHTTNNIMELMAARSALSFISSSLDLRGERVILRLDSEYVLRGMAEWLPGWKRRNWRAASGKPVKNREIWEELDQLKTRIEVIARLDLVNVRGHSGDPENERVDAAAVDVRDRARGAREAWVDPVRWLRPAGPLRRCHNAYPGFA